MSVGWLEQPERGTRLSYQLMAWVSLRFGRGFGRILLYPICWYFTLTPSHASRSIRFFLRRVLERPVRRSDIFRTYHCFASTLHDRVFLLSEQYQRFSVVTHGADELVKRVSQGEGCLLLGAHVGSFEIVRACGLALEGVLVNVLMYEENAQTMSRVLGQLNTKVAESIIPAGLPNTMFMVKDCLDRGELVGILGDRIVQRGKVVSCRFFGKESEFPSSPMLLASILQVPVYLFFGLYKGGNRYEVYFEHFSERVQCDRENREQTLQQETQRYVNRIEHFSRLAPHNWFNFYDFWNEQE